MTSSDPDDTMDVTSTHMIGHILIRDKDTGEVLVNQRDGLVHQKRLGNENEG